MTLTRSSRARKGGRAGAPLGRLTRALAMAVLALGLVPASALADTGDWPQFRENPAHQAHNTAETVITDMSAQGLGVAWTGSTGGAVNSSPAVANGVVYVGSNDGKLYAFAVGCGTGGAACTPVWTASTGAAIDSSPSTAGNRVYVGSTNGKLYAFAVGCASGGGTCSPVWTATTGGAIHSSPVVSGNVVYVGSDDGELYAFAVGCASGGGSCSPVWTATTGGPVQSSPAVSGNRVFVGSNDGILSAFAVGCGTGGASCSPVWTATTGGAIHSSPAILNNVVYAGSLDGHVYAYDALGVTRCTGSPVVCTPIWSANIGSPIYTSPSLGDGRVWFGADDGTIYTYRQGCGTNGGICTAQWTGNTGGAIRSSPASAHDVLYTGSNDGKIYAWDADCATNGSVCPAIWSASIGTAIQSSPAVAGGYLYVGSDNGKLYAFHVVVDHLTLAPATASIVAGAHQVYTAEGFDAANHDLGDFTASTTFTVNNGGNCTANACGATIGGTYTVTGTYEAATGQATLNVSSTGSTFVPIDPARMIDTRHGNGGWIPVGVPRTVPIAGQGHIPAQAIAITGNLTVTQQSAAGFLSIGPTPQPSPKSSTINFPTGDNRANGVYVALAGDGSVSITFRSGRTSARTHAILDVTGYFLPDTSGATYGALDPARILDTRHNIGLGTSFVSGTPQTFQVTGQGGVPDGATAVTGNLTVTEQTSSGFLSVGPNAESSPGTSTLNFPKGDTRANGVTVRLGTGGKLSVTFIGKSGAHAHVLFDVTGFFTPGMSGATFVAVDPVRLLDTRVSNNGLAGFFHTNLPRTVQIAGRGGLPAAPTAVTGNMTVVQQSSGGYLYVGPLPLAPPLSSTLNFPKNDTRANNVAVALGSGTLSITFEGGGTAKTHVLFDVTGYFVH